MTMEALGGKLPVDGGEPIHSGHFMKSQVHLTNGRAEDSSSDEDVEVDVTTNDDIVASDDSKLANSATDAIEKPVTFYKFGPTRTKSIIIDDSLGQLKRCLTTAYEKMTTPKWKDFKGLRLNWKQRIRLNNVIWRAWYQEFGARMLNTVQGDYSLTYNTPNRINVNTGKAKMASFLLNSSNAARGPVETSMTFTKRYCYFSMPDDNAHQKFEGNVLEGMYWKRRMEAVRAQYRGWRHFFIHGKYRHHSGTHRHHKRGRRRALYEPVDEHLIPRSVVTSTATTMKTSAEMKGDRGDEVMFATSGANSMSGSNGLELDDWNNALTDGLFDSLSKTGPYMFPDPKEIAQAGNAQFIQPGLLTLQPSLEEIIKALDSDEPFPDAGPLTSSSTELPNNQMPTKQEALNTPPSNTRDIAAAELLVNCSRQSSCTTTDNMYHQQRNTYSNVLQHNPYNNYPHNASLSGVFQQGSNTLSHHLMPSCSSRAPVASKGALKAFNAPLPPPVASSSATTVSTLDKRKGNNSGDSVSKVPRRSSKTTPGLMPTQPVAVSLTTGAQYALLQSSPSPQRPIPIRPAPDVSNNRTTSQGVNFQPTTPRATRRVPADSSCLVASPLGVLTSALTPTHSGNESSASPATPSDRKRQLHLQAEQSRREALKEGFARLCKLLPRLHGESQGRHTNAAILSMAAERIREMQREEHDHGAADQLRTDIAELRNEIVNLQANLPATPSTRENLKGAVHARVRAHARNNARSDPHAALLWMLLNSCIEKCHPVEGRVGEAMIQWACQHASVHALRAQLTNLLITLSNAPQAGNMMTDARVLHSFLVEQASTL